VRPAGGLNLQRLLRPVIVEERGVREHATTSREAKVIATRAHAACRNPGSRRRKRRPDDGDHPCQLGHEGVVLPDRPVVMICHWLPAA